MRRKAARARRWESVLRKVLLVAVITVVVLFGGLLIAPSFVDWNIYKGQVTNQVRASIGRDLAVDGDLSLTLIPRPTLVATGVRVGNIEGATIVVSSEKVSIPVAAQYAWCEYAEPNFYNKENLPAAPFRTEEDKNQTSGK